MKPICDDQVLLSILPSVDAWAEAMAAVYLAGVLFTDYFMEDRDGLEVIEMLRDKYGGRIYIIAQSSECWAGE